MSSIKIAAAVGFCLAGLIAAGSASAQVKIGAVLSVTGPASFLGDPEKRTLEIYVDEINAKGGVNGQKLQLVVYDDGADANAARTFATRLVEEDKVVAMVGGSTTGATLAMIPLFEEAQIPFISLAGAIQIIEPVRKWVFKTPHTDKMACEKIFADLKQRNLTTIALISGTDAFGKSMRDQCVAVAPKAGITIAHEEILRSARQRHDPAAHQHQGQGRRAGGDQSRLRPGPGDRHPQLSPARHHAAALPEPRRRLEAVHRSRRPGRRRRAAAGRRAARRRQAAGQRSAEAGRRRTTPRPTSRRPASRSPTFGGHAYDGLMIFVEAAKRAGSFDKAKVRDEIEKTKSFIGTGGVVNMSPTDHLGLDLSAFRMLEIKGGDWTLVR